MAGHSPGFKLLIEHLMQLAQEFDGFFPPLVI